MKPERIVAGVRLSNPDKMLYPEQGISKGLLADYYVAVAERMLPHVAFRPVTIVNTGEKKKLTLRVEVPVEDMARAAEVAHRVGGVAGLHSLRDARRER